MSKLVAIIRRLFLKNENGQKNSTENEETQGGHTPNNVQKATKAPRHYDEVILDDDGSGPKLQTTEPTNNVQVPPQRAPRSYEEVDLPPPDSGQKIEVKG